MNPNKNLVSLFALFFLLGVGMELLWEKEIYFILKIFGLALFCFIGLVFIRIKFFKDKAIWLGVIVFLGFWIGFLRASWELTELNFIKKEGEIEGLGLITKEPKMKKNYQEVVLTILECQKGSFCQNNQNNQFFLKEIRFTKVLVFLEKYQNLKKGDKVSFSGELHFPKSRNDSRFDYRKFLAKDRIFYVLKKQKIKKEETQETIGNFWRKNLSVFKGKLEDKIIQLYPSQEAAFLAGILLGGDDRMEESLRQKFIKTGMIHLVAVSGFNITILAVAFIGFAIFIGFYRKDAFWLALVGIWIFLALIDFPSSGVRAGIMGSLLLWAIRLGRLANSNQALLLAAFLMVFISPLALFYDIGFQLSFLATWGIINLYPFLAEKFNIKNDFLELKSILIASFSAQLGVLGLLVFNFEYFSPISFLTKYFSPISFLTNILILPVIPALMLAGFVSVVFGFILMPLAQMIALVIREILYFQIMVVDFFSRFNFSQIEVRNLGIVWLLGYYIFVFLFSEHLRKRTKFFSD